MNLLRLICLTLFQLVKQVCLLPKNIKDAVKLRQYKTAFEEHEAERLDRLRNPSKYLGK